MLFLITHTDRLAGQDWGALVFSGLDLMLAPSANKKIELIKEVLVQLRLTSNLS